jgi:peptidoglycan hydrolase-like protein with peptidoglycan-binding domain
LSVSGQVTRRATVEVALGPSDGGLAVVTAHPTDPGASLKAGQVVLEVSGRPIVLVTGAFPFYRPLRAGDSGPDVGQLQRALKAAGFTVTVDDRFGAGTAAAVRALYRATGYSAPTGPSQDEDEPAELVVPPTEFAVVPALPVRIGQAPAVGEVLTGDSRLVLESGSAVVRASIPAAAQVRLEPGMSAVVQGAAGDQPVSVASIGEADAETGEAELLLVGDKDHPLPDDWLGADVVAVITIELLQSDALLVPSTAVIPGGIEPPAVEVVRGDSRVLISVRELASLDGVSAIEPIDAELDVGDLVRVG